MSMAMNTVPTPPPTQRDQANSDDDEQISSNNLRQKRTRNTRIFTDPLSKAAINRTLSLATIGTRIQVTWSMFPDPARITDLGSITAKTKNGFIILYDDHNVGSAPMPPVNNDVLIYSIEVLGTSILNRPLNASNRPPISHAPTIFMDGGARPSAGGPGASAILLQTTNNLTNQTATLESHARFYPAITNNIAEFIAMHAALTMAQRLLLQGETHINLVTDSEIAYKSLLGINTVKDPKLKDIATRNRTAFLTIVSNVSIGHMMRAFGNPADALATKAILTQQNEGDLTLFTDAPALPANRNTKPQPAMTQTYDLEIQTKIESLQDFTAFRALKARSRAPNHAAPIFSHIAAYQLRKALNAPNPETREEAFIKFMILPSLYLPQNASSKRILRNLNAGTPFNVRQQTENAGRKTRTHDEEHRLTEAVQRLVMDRKLRSANKLIQQVSEQADMPFEQKVEKLKLKFVNSTNTAPSIDFQNIPHISAAEINDTLAKMSKQAATAIDSWTPTLLLQCTQFYPEFADMLATILTIIITQPLSQLLKDILLAGRLVAIPKGTDDVRPIVVSSVFVNILGSIAITRDDRMPSIAQYAIKINQGCQRIIHRIRHMAEAGKTIVKFDLKNAFGLLPRKVIENCLAHSDSTLRQFFRLVYGQPTTLVTFGPDSKKEHITFNEGVKQGDSAASYLFCHGIDIAILNISKHSGIPLEDIFAYMDDLTFAVDTHQINSLVEIVIREFGKIGMQINLAKSAALTNDPSVIAIPKVAPASRFIILGIDISTTTDWINELQDKQMHYFNLLRKLNAHPHIKFILLRICAAPRITYHCSLLHPDQTHELTFNFMKQMMTEFTLLLDPTGNTFFDPELLTHSLGLGIPDLVTFRTPLYNLTREMALQHSPDPPRLALVHNHPLSAHGENQVDAQWLFYNVDQSLTPAQFSAALAIRLNTIPPHLDITRKRCPCGHMISALDMYTHILTCDQSTGLTHAIRHNIVRDAFIRHCRKYAITCTAEPNIYSYEDGRKHRPDILFHLEDKGIATDITVVSPFSKPGDASSQAEKQKSLHHTTATSNMGHQFIPCAFEAFGYLGDGFIRLGKLLSRHVPVTQKREFLRDLTHLISTSLAAGRSDAIMAAWQRHAF